MCLLPKDEYQESNQLYQVAKAAGAKKGDLVEYFSANKITTGKSWSLDSKHIDISHYKHSTSRLSKFHLPVTILFTGHGNYLIPLKPIREHSANCKEFLQFIERYLSTRKSDAQHKSYFIKKLLITNSRFYKFKWYGSS